MSFCDFFLQENIKKNKKKKTNNIWIKALVTESITSVSYLENLVI